MKPKILLAFSGGLDTTYCVKYLQEDKGYEVHTALVNTGGFTKTELDEVHQKALKLGAKTHINLEETESYYQAIIKYLIFGNVLKNGSYPLSVSAERVHQAKALIEYAKKIGANAIAHGSTGAGNDQVRFDLTFQLLAPEIEIVTPIRDQQLSRQAEIEYLAKHGVILEWKKAQYSVNKGLWGTSVGGAETLTSNQALPEEAYPSQLSKSEPEELEIGFKKGEPISLNGKTMSSVNLIQKVDAIASKYAIGRDIHVGDTIIGIKGRVGFEAAAAHIIIKAHQALEKHTLGKWQMHWKEQLGSWYGMFVHESQYFDPVMRNIEEFLQSTQESVSGKVFLKLHPYRFEILGIESPFDLMNTSFGDYGEMNKNWTGEDVKGFTKILANSMKIHQSVNSI